MSWLGRYTDEEKCLLLTLLGLVGPESDFPSEILLPLGRGGAVSLPGGLKEGLESGTLQTLFRPSRTQRGETPPKRREGGWGREMVGPEVGI